MATFLACSLLTALSMVAAVLPASWLLLATLLRHRVRLARPVSRSIMPSPRSCRRGGWARSPARSASSPGLSTRSSQDPIGRWIDRTHSYSEVTFLAGLMPLIGLLALLLLWNAPRRRSPVMITTDP